MPGTVIDALDINRAYYAAHADEFCRRTADLALDELYGPFTTLLPAPAHVLDAGCGSGRDSLALMRRGYRVTAIDASPEMVRAAKSRGVDARLLTFQEMKFVSEFDGIWACASLLHVPHAEISEVLRRFHHALRSGGILYVSLKEGSGERVAEDGRFFSYFSLAGFKHVLEDVLFRVVDSWQSIDKESSGAPRSWLSFIAKKKS
jgi:SAM-dependent methyltransferase